MGIISTQQSFTVRIGDHAADLAFLQSLCKTINQDQDADE